MKSNINKRKRLVLKNRKRFAAFISCILIISIFMIFTSTVYSYKTQQFETVKVKQGDTLWGIADKYGNNTDIRKLVYDIKIANNLSNSEIIAGTELKIPLQ